MDPAHIAPSRTDANSNGHFPPSNGQNATGTPRGFNLQNYNMNSVLALPGFPPMPGAFPPMFGAAPMQNPVGWQAPGGDDRGPGPLRRGGAMGGPGGRFNARSGPYDRRPNGRFPPDGMAYGTMGGRGKGGAGRWGDGAGGGAAIGPREAIQGRTLRSYEDLDQVSGGGGGELNY